MEHRQPEDDPFDSAPKLAENLIAPEVVKAQAANPKLSAGEAREMVIDKRLQQTPEHVLSRHWLTMQQ